MAGTYTNVELPIPVSGEKEDLLTLLADQRALFRIAVRDLTDEQARTRSTVSELTLGGLVKHVTLVDRGATSMIVERDPEATVNLDDVQDAYNLRPDETLAHWLAEYDAVAAEFDRVVSESELDDLIPQATAPWQPEREWWSVRRMVLHSLRETAHHCGHADIIREALDGQSTMAAISEGADWAESADWD